MEAEEALTFRVGDTTPEEDEPPSAVNSVSKRSLAIGNGLALLPSKSKPLASQRNTYDYKTGLICSTYCQQFQHNHNPSHRTATTQPLVYSMQPCSE